MCVCVCVSASVCLCVCQFVSVRMPVCAWMYFGNFRRDITFITPALHRLTDKMYFDLFPGPQGRVNKQQVNQQTPFTFEDIFDYNLVPGGYSSDFAGGRCL